ncbi:MAG: DUF5591 domain-containing protein [Novosphingobium sp.]|nr:DUF5591 domain-containing protein [Novosphingobium sp.]
MEALTILPTDDELISFCAKKIIGHRKKRKALFTSPFYQKDHTDDEVLEWGKKNLAPILEEGEEVIKRKDWDLQGLVGASEKQLLHPHFEVMKNYFFSNYNPQHDVAVVMLCANKKPYRTNFVINSYYKLATGKADFFILSNPGVIPAEYDNYYPFRWYEWPEDQETKEIKQLYTDVTKQRIEEWFNHFPYKKILCAVRPGETLTSFNDSNIPQEKYSLFEGDNWERLKIEALEAKFKGNVGLFKTRLLNLTLTHELFTQTLNKIAERN